MKVNKDRKQRKNPNKEAEKKISSKEKRNERWKRN